MIKRGSLTVTLVSLLLIGGFFPKAVFAMHIDEAFDLVTARLIASQYSIGTWANEEYYTGSILAGLAYAYEVTSDSACINSCVLGANFCIEVAGGNFYGDEAYALARITDITEDPVYADAVLEFYNGINTHEYIAGFNATDLSNAVFYIAHHAVAAHKVGANDAGIWREALIYYLSLIDDDYAYYPVMSLGVATWALAKTGPMDDTKIDPDGLGQIYWADVKLSDLPDLLSTHQVLSGEYAGSFYYRFDHEPAGPGSESSGYTEDTIFGVLGLIAANEVIVESEAETEVEDTVWDFEQEIQSAREALTNSVNPSGFVWSHIWVRPGSKVYYVYGGELLEAL
jgi:hypothetical protein